MGAWNTLTDGYVTAPEPPPPADDNAGATRGAGMGPHPSQMGPHIAELQGTPPLMGDHNIPLHVGLLGLIALGIVIAIRLLGFNFSGAGKIGLGGG